MRKKILVADDNRSITEVLQLNFSLLGYEVQVASDGEEAERRFREWRPDILILDVMMPKQNGYTVCRNLKQDPETRVVPIILLTAKNLREDVYWGYDSGADAYMTKPYDPRQLEILVDQLLREAETGTRTTAWTGLPVADRVRAEHEARIEAGAPSLLLELSLSEDGLAAFAGRYGQARAKDFVHRCAWLLYDALQRIAPTGVIGQTAEDGFLVTLDSGEDAAFREGIQGAFQELLNTTYDPTDVERGALVWSEASGPAERRGPLLALRVRESGDLPA